MVEFSIFSIHESEIVKPLLTSVWLNPSLQMLLVSRIKAQFTRVWVLFPLWSMQQDTCHPAAARCALAKGWWGAGWLRPLIQMCVCLQAPQSTAGLSRGKFTEEHTGPLNVPGWALPAAVLLGPHRQTQAHILDIHLRGAELMERVSAESTDGPGSCWTRSAEKKGKKGERSAQPVWFPKLFEVIDGLLRLLQGKDAVRDVGCVPGAMGMWVISTCVFARREVAPQPREELTAGARG